MKKDIYIPLDSMGFNEDFNIKFSIGRTSLNQRVLKEIFTSRGSNALNPGFGTIVSYLYKNIRNIDISDIKTEFSLLLKSIENKIIMEQIGDSSLKSSEKLLSLNLNTATMDRLESSLELEIEVITQDRLATTLSVRK
jgi:hypothetical protein